MDSRVRGNDNMIGNVGWVVERNPTPVLFMRLDRWVSHAQPNLRVLGVWEICTCVVPAEAGTQGNDAHHGFPPARE